jgi:hypothetical protein
VRGHHLKRAALLLAVSLGAPAMAAAPPAAKLDVANYEIQARLVPERNEVPAHAVLHWTNTTQTEAKDLCLHLYLNAFANNRTTLMSDLPDAARRWSTWYSDPWGGIDVSAIRVGDRDATHDLEFIRPDDGNRYDRTLARLPLRRPVAPGGSVDVAFDFVARLPRLFMRSGEAAPFYFVAQWFPKVGVFENGGWNCHQYHSTTEFYADFGTYDVALTVPQRFVVGSTGVVTGERANADGTRTIQVRAEKVHDFAWTADPRFRVIERPIAGVRVRLLIQPHHLSQKDRYLDALGAAMTRYAEWFGPYPYPLLTVVDPGPGGFGAAGMEYPTLITVGTTWWMPEGIRLPEMITVHEFGHQYWYGMVANDEVDEPWLDEGIDTYVEGRIMDEVYGPGGSYVDLFGLRVDATAEERLRYLSAGRFDPIARSAHRMLDRRSYDSTAYAQTALTLRTLDDYLGGDRLRRALGDYFRQWRFRHPTGADWRAAIEASTGEDLSWFFKQVVDGSGRLDYAVSRVDVRKVRRFESAATEGESESVRQPANRRFRNEVVVERRGEVQMPVDILLNFDDGSETHESWDGRERWHRLDITGTVRASYAIVDPKDKLPLDVDRLNNSRMRSPSTRGIARLAGRWGLWLEGMLHLATGL